MSRLHKPEINFTQVSNQILTNAEVSLKAKGLYVYLVSKPDNYDFSAKRIAKECKENYTTILGVLNELEERKYLLRKKYGDGTIDYYLFNEPKEHPNSANLQEDSKLENPTQEPKLQSPTLQPISNTTSSTKKDTSEIETTFPQPVDNWQPKQNSLTAIKLSCRNMTENDILAEVQRFKLHFEENWPASPDTKFIKWCQDEDPNYLKRSKQISRITHADELSTKRIENFDHEKQEKIRKINNKKTKPETQIDIGQNYPISEIKRLNYKSVRVYSNDFPTQEMFNQYLTELRDLDVGIYAMDFILEEIKSKNKLKIKSV